MYRVYSIHMYIYIYIEREREIHTCEPFVFGPAFAMERTPGPVCFSVKFSSANLAP